MIINDAIEFGEEIQKKISDRSKSNSLLLKLTYCKDNKLKLIEKVMETSLDYKVSFSRDFMLKLLKEEYTPADVFMNIAIGLSAEFKERENKFDTAEKRRDSLTAEFWTER